jgi:hypothetical protein
MCIRKHEYFKIFSLTVNKNALWFLHCRLVVAGYLLHPGVQRDALVCVDLYKRCGGPNWINHKEEYLYTAQQTKQISLRWITIAGSTFATNRG